MDQKVAIADRLKQANNILVTVSNNPSVDQLAACIGLTLALNKMDKHATAVFSGNVPSTIEFLQPEKTLEKTTDSLRDFIIALDKSKADKLRYKVEDKVVKIFITPYRTSISERDLDFSQGDFNVDVVIALGVHSQQDLDQAITAHGRILHDAVVVAVNIKEGGELGTINWVEPKASSLSELVTELLDTLDKNLMDNQMATALLTGIVAETNRFSNDKTSPVTMSISAELMSAGANQQLVATKLEQARPPQPQSVQADRPADIASKDMPAAAPKPDDGTLEIAHDGTEPPAPVFAQPSDSKGDDRPVEIQEVKESEPEPAPEVPVQQIHIDDQGSLRSLQEQPDAALPPLPPLSEDHGTTDPIKHMGSTRMILQPPSMGGQMSASGLPEDEDQPTDPLSLPTPSVPANDSPVFGSPASAATATPVGPTLPFAPALPAAPVLPPSSQIPMPPASTPAPQPPTFGPLPSQTPPPPAMPTPASTAATYMPPAATPAPAPVFSPAPTPPPPPLAPTPMPPITPPSNQTLTEIEQGVSSPHVMPAASPAPTPPVSTPSFSAPTPPAPQPPTFGPLPSQTPPPPAMPTPASTVTTPTAAPAAPSTPAGSASTDELSNARQAVLDAINSAPPVAEPIQALNAQPLGAPLHDPQASNGQDFQPATVVSPTTPPPPGPPPMMPPTGSV